MYNSLNKLIDYKKNILHWIKDNILDIYYSEFCSPHFMYRVNNFSVNQPTMKIYKIQSVSNKLYWNEAEQSQSCQFEGGCE